PSATQIVSMLEWLMKSWFDPSLPCTYPGMTSATRSFLPTEPASVRLASVKGTRTDTPIAMARLNRLSNNPTVRTTRTLAQPQPPRPRARYRRGLLGSWLIWLLYCSGPTRVPLHAWRIPGAAAPRHGRVRVWRESGHLRPARGWLPISAQF